jgi:hypothetical protein
LIVPVVIEELTTTLEIQDELKIRKLVGEEVRRILREERERRSGRAPTAIDPSDSTSGGISNEG